MMEGGGGRVACRFVSMRVGEREEGGGGGPGWRREGEAPHRRPSVSGHSGEEWEFS